MADNDVKIKLSLDGDKLVIEGLQGVGDSASEADSKLGSFVGKGLKGAGAALVGLGVAGVAAGAALSGAVISSYADYEQNLGGIETMFKESSDKMVKYADEAYLTAGLSANEYMSQVTSFSASLLQGLGGDTEAAADAANLAMVDMSDNANKFGTNIGDIQNAYQGFAKQNFTMLDNLKLGYGGTKEEMQRLMDDASKLPAAMGQEFDLNNFADVTQAIHLIQDEMGVAGTTALEASETISGSVGMLKGSFDNLLTGLGSADADVATLAGNVITSLETVVSNVGPVLENLGSNMEVLGPQLGSMLEGLVGVIADAIPGLIQAGVSMIGGLVQGLSSALPGLITALVPAIVGIVEMVSTQLPLLVDAGMKAVIALGQGLVEALPTLLPMIVQMVTGIAQSIVDNLPMLLQVALQLVQALATGVLDSIPVLLDALPMIISSLVAFLVGAIPQLIDAGLNLFMSLVTALPEIITGIVDAIPVIITALVSAVVNAIPQLIDGGLKLFMGLIGALPQIITGVVGALPQIISAIVSTLGNNIPRIIQAGIQLLGSLVSNLGPVIGTVAGAIPKVIGAIVGAVGNGIGQMASAGGDLVRGLWNGISDAAGWLMGKISGFVDDVMGGIKDFFGIKSPSRRMEFEVGVQLPAGIGGGVERNEDAALEPLRNLNDRMMEESEKITGLTLQHTLDVAKVTTSSASSMVPQRYMPSTQLTAAPTVVLDASSIRAAFEDIVTGQLTPTEVNVTNNIDATDTDPRITGRQIGRSIEEVLIG